MPCNRIDSVIDDYLDSSLATEATSRLTEHLERCIDCRGKLDNARELRDRLRVLPVEGPRPDFFAAAIAAAQNDHNDSGSIHRKRFIPAAIAAAVLIWFAGSFLFDASKQPALPALPEFAIHLDQTKPVNLVFSSAEALTGARVSLLLPQGIELAGYSGRRELSWTADLKPGKNVLQLPITAIANVDAEIVARLEHGSADKTFRVKVRVI